LIKKIRTFLLISLYTAGMKINLEQIKKGIPEADRKNPSVILLLELLEQQAETNLLLKEQIQELKDEISRLKKHKPKPKIKTSRLIKG
jgi:hypothetical protein